MVSSPQVVATSIQLNDCLARMFIDFGASCPLALLFFFLVIVFVAVGYDYSK